MLSLTHTRQQAASARLLRPQARRSAERPRRRLPPQAQRYSVYLLYWYKSTCVMASCPLTASSTPSSASSLVLSLLALLALLVQKYLRYGELPTRRSLTPSSASSLVLSTKVLALFALLLLYWCLLTYADECWRMLAYAGVCCTQSYKSASACEAYADVC
jgi:hypothetical protein